MARGKNAKNQNTKKLGLRGKLFLVIIAAAMAAALLVVALISVTDLFLDNYYEDETQWADKTAAKADELQEYITSDGLSTKDVEQIREWDRRNRGVYIFLYNGDETIYESSNFVAAYSSETYREIRFSDANAELYVFYALDYRYYMIAVVSEILAGVALFFVIVLRSLRQTVVEIRRLEQDVRIMEGGSLDHVIEVKGNDEIASLEQSLDNLRIAFRDNLKREEQLSRANNELVTRMAHDLRTPLTSLLLYLDLIKEGKYSSEEELSKYVEVSRDKAERIKIMSDQLFERFLITGESADDAEISAPEDVRYAFEDLLSAFVATVEAQGFRTEADFEWPEGKVAISLNYVQRILDNLYSNLLKYADKTSPVRISLGASEPSGGALTFAGQTMLIRMINKIGDRSSESDRNNIGLENIDLMMGHMNGSLRINDDGEYYETILEFPLS